MAYSSLRQQAIDHRDQYEGFEEDQLQNEILPMNPMMGSGAGLANAMRMRHGQERAAANFNPQWDAWQQAVGNAAGGRQVNFTSSSPSRGIGTSESRGFYSSETPDLGTVRAFGRASQIQPVLQGLRQSARSRA